MHDSERIVITGIGLVSSIGNDRESMWAALCRGQSGVRRLTGLSYIPDGLLLGATTQLAAPDNCQLKTIFLAAQAAREALRDSCVSTSKVVPDRFGCAVSGHIGDTRFVSDAVGRLAPAEEGTVPWWHQWLPNTASSEVARLAKSEGPRLCHSVACASGLIDILSAVRSIRDGQCDVAIAGSAESIDPLFAAGFYQMKVLAQHEDPQQACRPFDRNRTGFVMGEGAGMFIIERLSHALQRRARIYAEVVAGKMLAEAHHVTGLDEQSEALTYLLRAALRQAELDPEQIGYINAHGTGTEQNDVVEARGIRRAFGRAADRVLVSASKSMLGHLVNASGSVELGITALALRDGFAPPTLNLTDPDPACDLDCVPLVGRRAKFDYAMKVSVAFGGHLAAVILKRWEDPHTSVASNPAIAAG